MRTLHWLFISVFFTLTALPLFSALAGIAPSMALRGAVATPERVALSRASYAEGRYQQAFEQRFNADFGYRAHLIRADNQLNFAVFREFAPSPGTAMVLGTHGFIYERAYVDDYNRRNLVSEGELERKVQRLKLVQDYAEAHGLTLLVVISPSKALLYPENLPPRFVYPERTSLTNNYSVFARQLQEYGVHFIDMQASANEWKSSAPFTLFANTGAHWGDPVACQATSQIEHFIAEHAQQPGGELRCAPFVMQSGPRTVERDLLDLANLWSVDSLLRPTPYARARLGTRASWKPSLLFIGSSFLWQVLDYTTRFKLDRRDDFFYYYKADISYPGRHRVVLDPKQIDWQADVFGKQGIVIEINASVVEHVGWGFLEDAERVIDATK